MKFPKLPRLNKLTKGTMFDKPWFGKALIIAVILGVVMGLFYRTLPSSQPITQLDRAESNAIIASLKDPVNIHFVSYAAYYGPATAVPAVFMASTARSEFYFGDKADSLLAEGILKELGLALNVALIFPAADHNIMNVLSKGCVVLAYTSYFGTPRSHVILMDLADFSKAAAAQAGFTLINL